MTAMDLETAIDDVERFLTRWRNGSSPTDRGRMHDLGSVIIQAGLDPDAPELTTTHLETLLNAASKPGIPRAEYGVRFPDDDNVMTAPTQTAARAWAKEYATLVPGADPARVQRRTVTSSTTDWEDVDG